MEDALRTMLNIDALRSRRQRLARSLESWQQAKDRLANAIAFAEERERDLHEVSEDVQRKLTALDLVIGMASEPEREVPAERRLSAAENRHVLALPQKQAEQPKPAETETSLPIPGAAPDLHRLNGVLGKSSRPLFTPRQRTELSALSILR